MKKSVYVVLIVLLAQMIVACSSGDEELTYDKENPFIGQWKLVEVEGDETEMLPVTDGLYMEFCHDNTGWEELMWGSDLEERCPMNYSINGQHVTITTESQSSTRTTVYEYTFSADYMTLWLQLKDYDYSDIFLLVKPEPKNHYCVYKRKE